MTLKGVNQVYVDYYYSKINELKEKYGKCEKNYVDNNWCRLKEENKKGYKGLNRHHIDEFVFPGLCNVKNAIIQSYGLQMQKAENLVWCNQKEHILLHWIIAAAHNFNGKYTGVQKLIYGDNGYYAYNEFWCKTIMEQINGLIYDDPNKIIRCIETFWPK